MFMPSLFLDARESDGFVENILFHLPYDETRYRKVIEACALVSDFQILEDGDESEIGERGVRDRRFQF